MGTGARTVKAMAAERWLTLPGTGLIAAKTICPDAIGVLAGGIVG